MVAHDYLLWQFWGMGCSFLATTGTRNVCSTHIHIKADTQTLKSTKKKNYITLYFPIQGYSKKKSSQKCQASLQTPSKTSLCYHVCAFSHVSVTAVPPTSCEAVGQNYTGSLSSIADPIRKHLWIGSTAFHICAGKTWGWKCVKEEEQRSYFHHCLDHCVTKWNVTIIKQ